jgi:quercetin dioxygenase-like cupin family protein
MQGGSMAHNANAGLAVVLGLIAIVPSPATGASVPNAVRKMLIQHDLQIPGYTGGIASVEVPPGGREGRHTHPGPLYVYVQQGAITVETEGQPTKSYKAGDTFFIEAGKIHEGINYGSVTYKSLTSFVIPKGQPLTTQVP